MHRQGAAGGVTLPPPVPTWQALAKELAGGQSPVSPIWRYTDITRDWRNGTLTTRQLLGKRSPSRNKVGQGDPPSSSLAIHRLSGLGFYSCLPSDCMTHDGLGSLHGMA